MTQNYMAGTEPAATAASPSTPTLEPRRSSHLVVLMSALCMTIFLAALDTTITTTALPTMAEHFGASGSQFSWIGSAYLLGNAAAVPFWGKISDIFGRKPIMMIANCAFMTGSLIAALAINLTMLIAGRALQGLGAGGLIVLVNISVSDLFSVRERSLYLGVIGMVWAVSGALGPVVGGAFAERVTWRWCFWVNLPLDAISLVVLGLLFNVETPKTPLRKGLKAIDWIGSLSILGATLLLLLGLQFGGVTSPWNSAKVVCMIIFGILLFGVFCITQWKVSEFPLIPLRILANRSNSAVLVVCLFHGMAFISTLYFLPVYYQSVLGAGPLSSGIWLLPLAISSTLFMFVVGTYVKKKGKYLRIIRVGLACQTLAFGLFINFQPYMSWPRLIVYQTINGLAIGVNFQTLMVALQNGLAPGDLATGTATFGFIRMMGYAIGVVVGQVVFQTQVHGQSSTLSAAGIPVELVSAIAHGDVVSLAADVKHLTAVQQKILRKALTLGLNRMWILFTAISFIAFLTSFGIAGQELSKEHQKSRLGLRSHSETRLEDAERIEVK